MDEKGRAGRVGDEREALSIRGKPTAGMPLRQLEVMAKYARPDIREIAKRELVRRGACAAKTNFMAMGDRTLANIAKCGSERTSLAAKAEIERREGPTSAPETEEAAQIPDETATTQDVAEKSLPPAPSPGGSTTSEGESGVENTPGELSGQEPDLKRSGGD